MSLPAPVVREHEGLLVVRDDLLPGGTKTRYLMQAFVGAREVVYATPAQGGAQLALSYCARALGKAATLFVAKRKEPHARTREARALGARVFQVVPGHLNVVQARARAYAERYGATLLPWGGDLPGCVHAIAEAAAAVSRELGPLDEVWCAAGSGVLTRGLQLGLRAERFYCVRVGAEVHKPGRATVLEQPLGFNDEHPGPVPFPSCPNYDRKAWALARRRARGRALFWNVLGPSPTPALSAPALLEAC